MMRGTGILGAALLTACTVGPDYRAPDLQPPTDWSTQDAAIDAQSDAAAALARWWTLFGDDELNRLVARALAQNLDIRTAAARIAQARAQLDATAGGRWPSAQGSGSAQRYKIPEGIVDPARDAVDEASGALEAADAASGGAVPDDAQSAVDGLRPPSYLNLYSASIDASWELDLFGRTRRSIEAAQASAQSAVAARRGAVVAVLGEVGRQYAALRATQARVAISKHRLEIEDTLWTLARDQAAHGLVSDIDVAQAEAQRQATRASLPALQAQVQQAMHALSVLLGQWPGTLDAELAAATPPLPTTPEVPVGLPSQLLRNRPDIQQAERQLASANAEIGVAAAQRFPSLSLTASTGFYSQALHDLLERGSWTWNAGASLTVPIFDAGRLAATQRGAEAAAQAQLLSYRSTVLGAFQEVEDDLAGYAAEQDRYRALQTAQHAASIVLQRQTSQYRAGIVPYLAVLDADRSLAQNEDALAQADESRAQRLIALYKALGGGWQSAELTSAAP